ncbi:MULTISPECIES: hypothetical protein [Nostocales]|uniref:Uncharacterized protein n=4 Tax=Nostocales TaxID=1161 RepID=A0A8S9T7Y1_9CYAN|nr:hypothetical protein [Tolypothrix bouteillei]KAF3888107.1 hypothetical protein DA73_0400023395 [Tolypothrix bouteillei VB521301]
MTEKFWAIFATLTATVCGIAIYSPTLTIKVQTPVAQAQTQTTPEPKEDIPVEVFKGKSGAKSKSRSLRLSITLDNPSYLLIREGDEIKEGQTISDNKLERDRLLKQRKSVELQINNLKAKPIFKPNPPTALQQSNPIPPANYAEEEAAIAQAQLRFNQARSLLESRTSVLKADNPERRAEVEKAEVVLQAAAQKTEEQRQLLQSMQDLKLQSEIIQHEKAKLRQIEGEQEQARSALELARGKLNASAIEQQQQLQQLQLAVQLAQSELEGSKSRLQAAINRRQHIEYAASIDKVERSHKEQQLQQEYSRQQQIYEQALREREYQLAQLSLSRASVDEKLNQIPLIRSPKNGHIRRIKPWTGNNGKYTTTITISSSTTKK